MKNIIQCCNIFGSTQGIQIYKDQISWMQIYKAYRYEGFDIIGSFVGATPICYLLLISNLLLLFTVLVFETLYGILR